MHAAKMSGRRASGTSGASVAFASDMAGRTVIAGHSRVYQKEVPDQTSIARKRVGLAAEGDHQIVGHIVLCIANPKNPRRSRRFSSGRQFGELLRVGVSGGDQHGDDDATGLGELVAVGARDLSDQSVRPQQTQLARDRGSPRFLLGLGARRFGEQPRADVTVRKPLRVNSPRLIASSRALSCGACGLMARTRRPL